MSVCATFSVARIDGNPRHASTSASLTKTAGSTPGRPTPPGL